MTTAATFNITKILTVISMNYVYNAKLSNIMLEADKYNEVNITGLIKTEKLNKYISNFLNNGYVLLSENWNRVGEIADGVSDFSITFSKK